MNEFDRIRIEEKRIFIPTYPESDYETLPMFAENRNHQGTSGNPYPNAVVIKPRQDKKVDAEYTAVILENEFLKVTLLPGLGGKIFAALDKTTGYDFFYRQHVIKPAMIGALGSWISGGVEFNWPFHHRPSTLMPSDWTIERFPDGSATVWMSENDPFDRMKGMVGVTLYPGKSLLETKVRLFNRTETRHSFLWWENAAVSVNPDYYIFFPPDVDHVYHHYRRSSVSYPIAKGVYGGHDYGSEGVDISRHGNTPQSTSFFSAWSKFDYFGGYDQTKNCGVVHVADHQISPGKKMFTWAYNQLSKSWENMLTDTDGPYCELMAGSYTDNQPDFSWLEPYENKTFSQYWYPIGDTGIPTFANPNAAVSVRDSSLHVQVTSPIPEAHIVIGRGDSLLLDETCDLDTGKTYEFTLASDAGNDYAITITSGDKELLSYQKSDFVSEKDVRTLDGYPLPADIKDAHRCYLTGIHLLQYRDPTSDAEVYFKRALELDPTHTPSMIALGECLYRRCMFTEAREILEKALASQTFMNLNPESGKNSYLLGLTLDALGESDKAYDAFRKAAWDNAFVSPALTRAAAINMRSHDYVSAIKLLSQAISHDSENHTAAAYLAFCHLKTGKRTAYSLLIDRIIAHDRLNQLARWSMVCSGRLYESVFLDSLSSSPSQTVIDIVCDLRLAGLDDEANRLLGDSIRYFTKLSAMVWYMSGRKPASHELCRTFPFRREELCALKAAVKTDPDDQFAEYLLGCLLYGKRQYERAFELWSECGSLYEAYRGRACCEWRNGHRDEAIELLGKASELASENDPSKTEQIIYERAYLMNKSGADAKSAVDFILEAVKPLDDLRDDIALELCSAYNRAHMYQDTLELLKNHRFRPCEGGEAMVVAQYISAKSGMAREKFDAGDYANALNIYREAAVIPDYIGAGLWDESPLMDSKYYSALCLEKLGNEDEAKAILAVVADKAGDPLLRAKAMKALGRGKEAADYLAGLISGWRHELTLVDSGYFGASPFFISYMEDAKTERKNAFESKIAAAQKLIDEINAAE